MNLLLSKVQSGILHQEWEIVPDSEEELKALICDLLVNKRLSVDDGARIVIEARSGFYAWSESHVILTTDDAKVTGYRIRIFNLN